MGPQGPGSPWIHTPWGGRGFSQDRCSLQIGWGDEVNTRGLFQPLLGTLKSTSGHLALGWVILVGLAKTHLGLNPGSDSLQLCDLGQVTLPLILGLLICKTGVIMTPLPTSQGVWED